MIPRSYCLYCGGSEPRSLSSCGPAWPSSPTGAFCIPLYVPYVLTGRWPFGRGLCKLWLVADYLLCTSSVFNIVLISYDRFLSVTRAVSLGCRCPWSLLVGGWQEWPQEAPGKGQPLRLWQAAHLAVICCPKNGSGDRQDAQSGPGTRYS